jgi:hypothetical protein
VIPVAVVLGAIPAAVERLLRQTGVQEPAEFAGERVGERFGGVGVLAWAGVQGARVPALEQFRDQVRGEGCRAQVGVQACAERGQRAGSASSAKVGVSCRPSSRGGVQQDADRPFDPPDGRQLAVGECQSGV